MDYPREKVVVVPIDIFRDMAIATTTIDQVRTELSLERDSKEEAITSNIRLEALNKKLSSQQVLDKDLLTVQRNQIYALNKSKNTNLYIGLSVGVIGTSIIFILLN